MSLLSLSLCQHQVSEDCLYLNIYKPKGVTNAAIVAFIPGEGFDFADASHFDGSALAQSQKVIVVTIQYRVGAFGFLSLAPIADGNMALWDQIMALEWIRDNADAMGGDSSRITLFGRFTGSMSASILMTSPVLRNRSLFSRVILSSGIATKDWAISSNSNEMAANLLEKLNCPDVNCLMTADASKILTAASYGWRPTVDGSIVAEDPIKQVTKKHISKGIHQVMLGSNQMDGTICLLTHFAMRSQFYPKIMADTLSQGDLLDLLKLDSAIYFNNHLDMEEALTDLIDRTEDSLRQGYLDFCSRALIHKPSDLFASALKSIDGLTVYQYRFAQRAPKSVHPSFITTAGHGDDLIYAFGLPEKDTPEGQLSSSFMSYLASFIQTGSPGSPWKDDKIRFINFNSERNATSFNDIDSCTYDRKSSNVVSFLSTHDYSSWQLVNSLSL